MMKIRLLRRSPGSCLGNRDATVTQLPLPVQQCHCILFNVVYSCPCYSCTIAPLEIKYQGVYFRLARRSDRIFIRGWEASSV